MFEQFSYESNVMRQGAEYLANKVDNLLSEQNGMNDKEIVKILEVLAHIGQFQSLVFLCASLEDLKDRISTFDQNVSMLLQRFQ